MPHTDNAKRLPPPRAQLVISAGTATAGDIPVERHILLNAMVRSLAISTARALVREACHEESVEGSHDDR